MPWDNNTGGGGRNNNGGPWGQVPGGGGSGGGGGGGGGNNRRPGNTPNLEDLLARGRDRFQGGVPGGRWAIGGVVLALVAFWGFNSVYVINSNEVGVVTLFGKPKEQTSLEGLHFLLWPVEQVERVPRTENQIVIGTTSTGRTGQENGLMLSGDSNIADVQFSVLWQVENPIKFLYNVRDPEDLVRRTAESAMREVVGRRPVQDIFRDNRAGILSEVQAITQTVLEGYGAGVTINQVTFDNAQPPTEVADAFNDVQRAEQDEDRLQEEARTYANTLLGNARGDSAKIREAAAAYKQQVTLEAEGEAARFISVYNEYVNNPDVTRKRLYLETMEVVLGGANKVIMEKGAAGSGVVPYLPLPEVQSRATNSTTLGVTKP